MPFPVAAPAPNRSLPVLFVLVVLAVLGLRILVSGGALWPSVLIAVAAGIGATVVTWVLDGRDD